MSPTALRFHDRIFGTDVFLTGLAAPADALQRLRDVESSLTRFHPASDLSILNRTRAAQVSPAFVSLLTEAVSWMHRTGGLVSPFLGRTMIELGYDRDFATLGAGSASAQPGELQAGVDGAVTIDAAAGWVELPDGLDIDFGGFAKGWAADIIRTQDSSVRGIANVGGDLRAWSAQEPWQIVTDGGVAFELANGAVATSSIRRRVWDTVRGRMHHIIDPRTGLPAETDCVEATVIAGTALDAEVLAKVAVLSGLSAAPMLLTRLDPGVSWILTDRAGGTHAGGVMAAEIEQAPPRKASQ